METIMWFVAFASLVGVVANIYKKRWCFHLWAVTNGLWMVYDVQKNALPQAALMACYFGLALWGLRRWKK